MAVGAGDPRSNHARCGRGVLPDVSVRDLGLLPCDQVPGRVVCGARDQRVRQEECSMRAHTGDLLIVNGRTDNSAARRAMVLEAHGPDGSAPFLVRWLESEGHLQAGSCALGMLREIATAGRRARRHDHPARFHTPSRGVEGVTTQMIEYFHASKFGNGARVAKEIQKRLAARGRSARRLPGL